MLRKFLSKKFNLDIVQDKYFPQTVLVTALENKYVIDNLEYAIEDCVDFINNHGGFTVSMWYYRG